MLTTRQHYPASGSATSHQRSDRVIRPIAPPLLSLNPPPASIARRLLHGRRAPDGGAALGDLEDQAGVDEAVALDEAILLLALAGWP